VYDPPRRILHRLAPDFREMTLNRQHNLCCGGDGGLVANLVYPDQRLAAGRPKAEQICATGAKTVVASCDNCRHQIREISEHNELGTEVVGIAELVAVVSIERVRAVPLPPELAWLATHKHAEGPRCLVLQNVCRLATPIPYRGLLGLFDVPDELLAGAEWIKTPIV
jgi:hypothetical protein